MPLTTTQPMSPVIPALCSPSMDAREPPSVSVIAVRALLDAVGHMGGPRADLLRELGGLAESLHNDEARVPLAELCRVCELALDLTGDSALGLHWAEQVRPVAFAPVSHMIAHAPSLRNAFALLSRFGQLFSDQPFVTLTEGPDVAVVRACDWMAVSPRLQAFSAEVILGGITKMLRAMFGEADVLGVSLAYAAPSHAAEYERVFETVVRFDQPFSGLLLRRARLDHPAPHVDTDVQLALEAIAERRLERVTRHVSYSFAVREILRRNMPDRISMVAVARSLGLSVRSLRRQLAADGTSFRRLEYAVFESISKSLLRDRQRTIQEVAYELGFSDVTTFHRAFKRWTGVTPGDFRERPFDR